MSKCAYRILLIITLALCGVPGNAAVPAKRPVTAEDSVLLKRPNDAQISPDGKHIAFFYNETQLKTTPRNTDIWVVPTAGGAPRKLTNAPKSDSRPRWSPDGKWIAFLSDRGESGKNQIYLIRFDGGEAVALTNEKNAVSNHAWSPDGKRIAFMMTDSPSEEETKKINEKDDPELWDADFKYARLYTVDVETRKVTRVTDGTFNVWEYDWSPDGSKFVVAGSDTPRTDDSYVRVRLEVYPATGGAGTKLVTLSGKFPGKLRLPTWSPDGQTIAYLGSGGNGRESVAGRLWVIPASGGQARNLTEKFPGTFSYITWLPNKQVLAVAIEGVHHSINQVSPETGEIRPIMPASARGVLRGDVSISNDGTQIAMIKEDASHPADLWVMSSGTPTQLTRLNPQSEEWEWGSSEVIRWKAKDGLEIEGVLVKPLGYQAGKRYPLLVHVHGGPEAADTNGFHLTYSDFAYLMSARGYAVLLPNYRGSIGRGVEYALADQGDMGGKEFQDIMDGIDHLIQQGIVDGDRLGIGGWSYGGYMTAWAVTQTPRFKVGVMGAGIANWVSFMSQTDIPYENAESHWADALFANPKIYAERSPVEHVGKARTPVLILHGAVDLRVPVAQGQEFYSRLRFQGVPTSLVIYPREAHGLTEAAHQLDAIRRMNEWFDKYLK